MTTTSDRARGADIRARLTHPIIDSDGHTIEFIPAFLDYLKQVGGAGMVDRYLTLPDPMSSTATARWYSMSWEERRERWATRTGWWRQPTKNTLDRATAMVPRLLYERTEEIGLDYAVLYPSVGFELPGIPDPELRGAATRALNTMHAELFRSYAKRLTPVAVILAETPDQAIAEVEYSVKTLGLRSITIAGPVRRPIAAVQKKHPDMANEAWRIEMFGLDSEYNYDRLWSKCVELKVPVAFHQNGIGWGSRRSISNHQYNHIGHFAASGEAICKALFLGGVTRRFPTLNFAFQEGGVAWGCSLFADLIEHWEKRRMDMVQNYNPANLDMRLYTDLLKRYGEPVMRQKVSENAPFLFAHDPVEQPIIDEWAACEITKEEDFSDLFVRSFYFGCESGDRLISWAFNKKVNPLGARLNAVLGSDIGHFDVVNMSTVLNEVYGLVEQGLITEEDFRDLTFSNPVNFYTRLDPGFFNGTAVEAEVNRYLGDKRSKGR